VRDVLGLDVEIVLVVPAALDEFDGLEPVRAAEPRARVDDGLAGPERLAQDLVTFGNMYLT